MTKKFLYILDEHGEPIATDDILAWAAWFENSDDVRQVATLVLRDDHGEVRARIATVFLGIDHSFPPATDSAPILWETAVFWYCLDRVMRIEGRYSSRADAIVGHHRVFTETIKTIEDDAKKATA
jgi:hypothetical protein